MKFSSVAVALLFICVQFAQAQDPKPLTPAEEKEKLSKEAVVFLRETMGETANLRTLENRISFSSELAGLMWHHDEREARLLFTSVINDFRELMLQYDSQINALGPPPEAEEPQGERRFLGLGTNERQRLIHRVTAALSVRQKIALSIAEHDADLAFGFYHESLNAITNPATRKQFESRESNFESQLIGRIAQTNAAKAAQYGLKMLDKGFSHQQISMLKKIHAKDADKGIEFAEAILSRLKSSKLSQADFYALDQLLDFGEQTLAASRKPDGKKAALTQLQLRDVADLFARAILEGPTDNSLGPGFVSSIERFSPSRAAQIRTKFGISPAGGSGRSSSRVGYGSGIGTAPPPAMPGDPASSAYTAAMNARAEKEKAEQKMTEDIMKIGSQQLPKEERERIVAQARKIVMQTEGRDKKIAGLTLLAAQVAKAGDKEFASELMKEAESLANPEPKNYEDFLMTWMIATGYASVDPDKAFVILDEAIARANETIAAFIKIGEFMDVSEGTVRNGEAQVGAFGDGPIRGLPSELKVVEFTIEALARADMAKTKNLTNRFDRPEIRMLVKMTVLRTLLEKKPAGESAADADAEEDIEIDEGID